MIMPGMQKPHWTAPASTKASWMRCGFAGVPRPSTVMISAPSSLATLVVHDRTALPLTMTVQAPHWPFRSQRLLGARQAIRVPQKIEQARLRVGHHLSCDPVDSET